MKSFHEMNTQELWGEIRAMMQDEATYEILHGTSFNGSKGYKQTTEGTVREINLMEALGYLMNTSGLHETKRACQYVVECCRSRESKIQPDPGNKDTLPFQGNPVMQMVATYLRM